MADYPPLAGLDDMPLHSGASDFPNLWMACAYPERPPDADTGWDWRCWPCVVHAKATLMTEGDKDCLWYATPGGTAEHRPLSWFVARAEYWHALG